LAERYGVHRRTVRAVLSSATPAPRKPRVAQAPKLDPLKPIIDAMLVADLDAPRKQKHTARRIRARLVDEHDAADLSYSAPDPVQLMVERVLMPSVNAELDPYRGWTEPRDGVGTSPFRLASTVEPAATTTEISMAWPDQALRPELQELWLSTREARLFLDVDYGQWGLHILDPVAAAARTSAELTDRPGDFESSDVVIGEFLGDSDLLVVEAGGTVVISPPLDPRVDWPRAAQTLPEFLSHYFQAVGEKYWESS
jgi:hypothetical protein